MGLIIPNVKRKVVTQFDGRTQAALQLFDKLEGGKVVRVVEGVEGARYDGEKKATAYVQITPGTVKRITGYAENADRILTMKEGDPFNALLTPQFRGQWYKLAEFSPVEQPAAK